MSDQTLATADPGDGGSGWDGKNRVFNERDLAVQDLEDSLSKRTAHNEWGVRDYLIRGIFVIVPLEIWGVVGQDRLNPNIPIEGAIQISLQDVRRDFPEQRFYSLANGNLVDVHPRVNLALAQHSEVYR